MTITQFNRIGRLWTREDFVNFYTVNVKVRSRVSELWQRYVLPSTECRLVFVLSQLRKTFSTCRRRIILNAYAPEPKTQTVNARCGMICRSMLSLVRDVTHNSASLDGILNAQQTAITSDTALKPRLHDTRLCRVNGVLRTSCTRTPNVFAFVTFVLHFHHSHSAFRRCIVTTWRIFHD